MNGHVVGDRASRYGFLLQLERASVVELEEIREFPRLRAEGRLHVLPEAAGLLHVGVAMGERRFETNSSTFGRRRLAAMKCAP
jgi:hypothetical protein